MTHRKARLSRRSVLTAGGLCLAGSLLLDPSASASFHTTTARRRREMDPRSVSSVSTKERQVALTFDDGPDPQYTGKVLDILDRLGVAGTFFVIGRNAQKHPDIVAEILARGHEVANHTQDHLWLDGESAEVIREQILSGSRSISGAGAPHTSLFRPPRGWTSKEVADVSKDLGFVSVFWGDCLEAHLRYGERAAAAAVATSAHPGSIILCHDGGHLDGPNPQSIDRSKTVSALPEMVELIQGRGFEPVPLGVLRGESKRQNPTKPA